MYPIERFLGTLKGYVTNRARPEVMYPNNPQTYEKHQTPPIGAIPGQWSSGLCDCCNDPSNCLLTCCCPCVAFGQIAEIIDRGTTSCALAAVLYYALASVGCACVYTFNYRTRLRGLYSLEESPCADFFVHWCCMGCALCQEYRELKNRGTDPSIGSLFAQRLSFSHFFTAHKERDAFENSLC
ncbi:hypothetical protein AAC387_Pa02g4905 [Persea americana]